MSNQFYNHISNLILNYFNREGIKAGDRFFLQLDEQSDVDSLISALKNSNDTLAFSYKHSLGEEYQTFSIPFGEVMLVVANTSEDVKPDFLVTLRNLVGEQNDLWNRTALLSIVSGQLDSIQGGSSDLQKEGMPLHAASLFANLKNEIESSEIKKVDQIVLIDNLDNLMLEQSYQQITFFDFEDIFSTLQKGLIDDADYHKFGLFKDPDLQTFNGKDQKKRLKENRDFFDYVKKVHELGLDIEELQKKFSSAGVTELVTEAWKDVTYPKVNKFHQDFLDTNKKIKIEFNSIKVTDKLIIWDRPQKESGTGLRKRHIIIFNPEQKEEVEIQVSFNLSGNVKSLSSSFVKVPNPYTNKINVDTKITNLTAKISTFKDQSTFVRFAYKHDNKAALGAEFYIAVLPIDPIYIDPYRSTYLVDPSSECVEIQYEEDHLSFGDGFASKMIEITEMDQLVSVLQDEKLTIIPVPEAFNDNDELKVKIKFDQVLIPIILRNELPESLPISGNRIWKLIRETEKDIKWIKENNRLILENREFYFHAEYREYFEWENEWIKDGYKCARYESDRLHIQDVKLGDDLREAYSRFINYFNSLDSIPSLSTVTDEYKKRSLEYIDEYVKEIQSFKDGTPAGRIGKDLFRLGTIYSNDRIYFTPFHPIMIAFKLMAYDLIGSEEIDSNVLNRLNPDSLVPFLYNETGQLFKPDHQNAAMEWLTYKPVNNVSVSNANRYLAKVVSDKISQFKDHFSYLFMERSKAPLQINVINIANDQEVLRGIFVWMLKEIDKVGQNNIKPIEVTLYSEESYDSFFDLYARVETVEEFQHLFNVNLKTKFLEPEDALRLIRERLYFYKQDIKVELRYAHITFYKMYAQEHYAIQPMQEMSTGIAINGLYSSVPSMKDKENYKTGFGTKAYNPEDNYLTNTAYYVNELAANLRNGGNDSYRKGEAVLARTTTTDEETLDRIFKSSYWVTFVDPTVDLEFFNKYEGNLVVIHYSDQYSSSSRYDAITVTDKSDQYYAVIKEFLQQKEITGTDVNVHNTIKAFNTFNGEWLLRIIGSKGHYDREKLSIISAIKYSVSYFDHSNILWVPISLEEVLRVAGAVSLNKSDGVFTAKNLGVKGSHSDDLLLIGLENIDDKLSLHFYPVEVKIGFNNGDVIDKAKHQVEKTKSLFMDALTGEKGNSFTGKFYRNFFAQLFISNAKKLVESDFWHEKNYDLTDDVIERLLKDDYRVSNKLTSFIGEGAILSFQKNVHYRSAKLDDEVLLLNLTETDGYEGLVIPISKMRNWIQSEENDFIKEDMLSYQYRNDTISLVEEISTEEKPVILTETTKEEYKVHPKTEDSSEGSTSMIEKESEEVKEENYPNLEDVRIKIGRAENSNREVYWEYGNTGLANRHLLISGKSGQGKTYFMQCLLLEKSKLGISSIVIDYTEGFLPNQLEPEFVEYLGDKLKQKIVYNEKLPINPFQRNVRDIGGIQLPESNTDIAERIKSVFSAVYKTLGIQQQNAIYEAVLNGLNKYEDRLNLEKIRGLLEEDGSSYAKTALSQIRPLIDRDPFSLEDVIDWKEVIEGKGEIFIIQLTGFPRDVQLMITEFLLWDLWNYSVRFGNKNSPMPVIMDEAQNLDHTEKSPSARILTEGRKFGWSAWYATQFLKSQLDTDELARLQNSSQKVYFSPPEQELSNIAASLSKDQHDKKQVEYKLSTLKKGQCIVHAPIQKDNGELSNPVVTVVNIIPLSERI